MYVDDPQEAVESTHGKRGERIENVGWYESRWGQKYKIVKGAIAEYERN